jgi:hypothetical protein
MHWMERLTILRWTSKRLFLSLALEPPELHRRLRLRLSLGEPGQRRRLMDFKV